MNPPWYSLSPLAVFIITLFFAPWWAALVLALLWYPLLIGALSIGAAALYLVDAVFEKVMSWTR